MDEFWTRFRPLVEFLDKFPLFFFFFFFSSCFKKCSFYHYRLKKWGLRSIAFVGLLCIDLFFLQTDRWISLMFQVQTRHEGLSSMWKTTLIQRNKTDWWGAFKSRFICQNQGLKPTVEKYHFTILEEFQFFSSFCNWLFKDVKFSRWKTWKKERAFKVHMCHISSLIL